VESQRVSRFCFVFEAPGSDLVTKTCILIVVLRGFPHSYTQELLVRP
jgi:hypothetical protein